MQNKIISMNYIPDKLLETGVNKYFKKDDILLDIGETPLGIHILIKGTVIVINENANGNTNILFIVEPLFTLDGFNVGNNRHSYCWFSMGNCLYYKR